MIEDAAARMIYLDTNVFILAFEGDPERYPYLRHFFNILAHRQGSAITSELTLAEVLAPHRSVGREESTIFYQNLLVESGFIDLRPVTRSVLVQTAELRKHFRHKLPDAIHIVTSLQAGYRYFVSADKDGGRLPSELIHAMPDAASVGMWMDALRA
jgi:predicted nucleic acid-binding protein